jgi:hypothetical protein
MAREKTQRRKTSTRSPAKKLRELAKGGLVRIGSGKLPEGFWKMPRPKDSKGLVLKAFLEERAEGR